jgi:hypothetical protein
VLIHASRPVRGCGGNEIFENNEKTMKKARKKHEKRPVKNKSLETELGSSWRRPGHNLLFYGGEV